MATKNGGNSSTRADKPVFANGSVFKAAGAGVSRDESTSIYDAWASAGTYDEDMTDEKYLGAQATAKAVIELFPTNRDQVAILDLACGTGIVAEKLHAQGFRKIDGLDPSTQMLDTARQKNVYNNLYTAYLDHNPLPMKPDTYDCAVIAGGLCPNHVPTSGLRTMARVVKPGGLMVITMREAFLWEAPEYRGKLEREMGDMEREGVWRLDSRTALPNYFYHHTGVVFIFRKC